MREHAQDRLTFWRYAILEQGHDIQNYLIECGIVFLVLTLAHIRDHVVLDSNFQRNLSLEFGVLSDVVLLRLFIEIEMVLQNWAEVLVLAAEIMEKSKLHAANNQFVIDFLERGSMIFGNDALNRLHDDVRDLGPEFNFHNRFRVLRLAKVDDQLAMQNGEGILAFLERALPVSLSNGADVLEPNFLRRLNNQVPICGILVLENKAHPSVVLKNAIHLSD